MLMQDMDGDGIPDMVVEGDNGVIEIFTRAMATAQFSTTSEGGTSASPNALTGNGGHLAAIGKLGNDSSTTSSPPRPSA